VLKIESVGIHDNFFDLGGHSLLLAEVYAEMRRAFDRELTMLDLFRYTTISTLAAHLGEAPAAKPSADEFQDRARMQREARRQQRRPGRGGGNR